MDGNANYVVEADGWRSITCYAKNRGGRVLGKKICSASVVNCHLHEDPTREQRHRVAGSSGLAAVRRSLETLNESVLNP